MVLHVIIFIFSCFLLFLCGRWIISSLVRIAKYLEWKEFVVAFFIVALATSMPNLLVGITSALHGLPQLSFGDILGNNLFVLTIGVGLATLFAKGLPADSRMVQTSTIFTMAAAILPFILFLDGVLSRSDGLILISSFFVYIVWLFSKKERFSKTYNGERKTIVNDFKTFIKDLGKVLAGMILLVIAAEGIVRSSIFFADAFSLPLVLVGILIVGIGSAIPETCFAVLAARKAQTWMILGNLMGSVVIITTLVLGIVVLISPIANVDFSTFAAARIFLVFAILLFFFCVRTHKKVVVKEALFLIFLYLIFVLFEIFLQ